MLKPKVVRSLELAAVLSEEEALELRKDLRVALDKRIEGQNIMANWPNGTTYRLYAIVDRFLERKDMPDEYRERA